ncbi:MAG TPA: hypothetical protein VFC56_02690 [Stellaceae bacterium]|nr:hypothetical protein [Stellaceae bacterium]
MLIVGALAPVSFFSAPLMDFDLATRAALIGRYSFCPTSRDRFAY